MKQGSHHWWSNLNLNPDFITPESIFDLFFGFSPSSISTLDFQKIKNLITYRLIAAISGSRFLPTNSKLNFVLYRCQVIKAHFLRIVFENLNFNPDFITSEYIFEPLFGLSPSSISTLDFQRIQNLITYRLIASISESRFFPTMLYFYGMLKNWEWS